MIQRYDIFIEDMEPCLSDKGEWVKWEDVKRLMPLQENLEECLEQSNLEAFADGKTINTGSKPHYSPICNGKGIVPNGFYLYPQQEYVTTSTAPEVCRSCGGKGYILA
jgi:hypothetical protein